MVPDQEVSFFSFDGLRLDGTFVSAERQRGAVILVHGGGVDRNEDGFYTRFANFLSKNGYCSLRFDFRSAGSSQGTYADLTINGIANDIRSAIRYMTSLIRHDPLHLVGTSFGGGPCVVICNKEPALIKSLCLFNPLLNYQARLLEEKPYWNNDTGLTKEASDKLTADGFLSHGGTIKMTRPLINEACFVEPYRMMAGITVPTLIAHGTKDSLIKYSMSEAYHKTAGPNKFITIDGADHGFTQPGDVDYSHPQTLEWQEQIFNEAISWMSLA